MHAQGGAVGDWEGKGGLRGVGARFLPRAGFWRFGGKGDRPRVSALIFFLDPHVTESETVGLGGQDGKIRAGFTRMGAKKYFVYWGGAAVTQIEVSVLLDWLLPCRTAPNVSGCRPLASSAHLRGMFSSALCLHSRTLTRRGAAGGLPLVASKQLKMLPGGGGKANSAYIVAQFSTTVLNAQID